MFTAATAAAQTAGATYPVSARIGVPDGQLRNPLSSSATGLADSPAPTRGGSFALEALGGAAGSLAGIGLVALSASCGTDDLKCVVLHVGAGGAAGIVGATLGTTLAARVTGSPRSIAGAALGAVVGTATGLGVHYLLNHSSDRNLGDNVVVPIFVVSQGVFAALGSRILAR